MDNLATTDDLAVYICQYLWELYRCRPPPAGVHP